MRYCIAEAAALKGLKHSTKIVALMLAARTSDNTPDWPGRYVSFPGIDALVEDTGLQKRALYYAINELVEAKVIRVYKDRRPGARWDHNVYEWTATESPNYFPDWKTVRDKQQEAVGARLTDEGWEYCRTHSIGPNLAAERHPEFVLPAEKPVLIDALDVAGPSDTPNVEASLEDEGDTLPIDTPTPKKPARKAPKRPKAHVIDEDWQPSDKALARTREQYPSLPIDIEVRKFVAYWRDRGTKRPGWDRSWERWCANGNGFADGAWTQPPAPGAAQGSPAINPSTGQPLTRDDFGYACLDAGIDPQLYINYWQPHMGLPTDPSWPHWKAYLDRLQGRG